MSYVPPDRRPTIKITLPWWRRMLGGHAPSRRDVLVAAGGVVIGAVVTGELTAKVPSIAHILGDQSAIEVTAGEQHATAQGFQSGLTQGAADRQQSIERHLTQLAGIPITNALASAQQTAAATHVVVEPLAQATLAENGDGLLALAQAVAYATGIVQAADPQSGYLGSLQNLEVFLRQAHQLVGALPIPLNSYAQPGTNGYLAPSDAPSYLTELQHNITAETL